MKLYYCPKTRSTRPRWMLEELGIPYELVYIDLKKGEQKNPDFLNINPMGGVPALQDGSVKIFESAAIVAYLADKYGEGKFAPDFSSSDRGTYYQWMFFSMTSLDIPIVQIFYHSQFYPEAKRIPAQAEISREAFMKASKVLSDYLKGKDYMVGGSFSGADIMVASNLGFAKSLGLLNHDETLLNYHQKMVSRPAFKKATEN
jgi:glutathione S-transferase